MVIDQERQRINILWWKRKGKNKDLIFHLLFHNKNCAKYGYDNVAG